MPVGIKLDISTHDIIMEDGRLSIIDDGEKLAQDIKTRLKTLRGEVILDNTYGFPYPFLFTNKSVDLSEIETLIKQFILETNGVKRITKFFLGYSGGSSRSMTVQFSVEPEEEYSQSAITGEVTINVWNGQ